jgi:ubiquinone/menaquinone biosynthesis C-methylase UbiE
MASSSPAEEERIRRVYALRPVSDRYSWFSAAHLFMMQDRERVALRCLHRHGVTDLASQRILEVGCGHGQWLGDFLKWGASADNLTGIDLIPERIAAARARLPASVRLEVGSAAALDVPDESFDIVLQSTVLSSVLDAGIRGDIASELRRVVRRGGLILWYDFFVNNPRNRDVRGLKLAEIRGLFPDCQVDLRRVTLAPPLARAVVPRSRLLAELLLTLPWLRTHYCGVVRRLESIGP